MKLFIVSVLSFIVCHCYAMPKGVVLNIQYADSVLAFDSVAMKKSLSEIDFDMVTYRADKSLTIGEHADRILEILGKYHDAANQQPVFLLSDRMSSFVGLDVVSKDTTIVGLITLSGAFSDGVDALYDNMSMKKNMETIDSISLDHSKELYLEGIYNMIHDKKQGKKVKLTRNADVSARELRDLLDSQYGTSLVDFSLEKRLSRIKSWIVPIIYDPETLMWSIDLMNLSFIGNMYHLRHTQPIILTKERVVSEVIKQISELTKNNL